ncbi:hypothetical protein DBR32_01450 [Taibaiella sp. KBW10]|uniref:hypothetical protein n=1 Tax=Taibaiella sp. KBW10 TaxID=2153357 RepID=UPI000F5ABBB8|nr:hypothetical protein [Taibaiella sp. KBW10]RQO32303.1 hypothetical protein DBR32_01450 [Taibaiella sp. KBW10]
MKRNIDIQKEWEAIGARFDSDIALPSFKIPDNYFDNFPNEMCSIVLLKEDQPLAASKENPFSIPPDYFNDLSTGLLLKVQEFEQLIHTTSIAGLSQANPFILPDHYFDQFPETVWNKINEETNIDEELNATPLLSSLKKSNPFSTPEIVLTMPVTAPKVIADVTPAKVAPVVPMTVKKRLQWAQWSAAASIAIFFILGATWLQVDKMDNTSPNTLSATNANTNTMKLLASIPERDIASYVEQHSDEFDEFTLEANLANVPAATQTKNLESSLQNISDEDIEAYLNTY